MSKSKYETRTMPLKAVHPIVWAVAGLAFIILSVALLVAVIAGGVQSFRGMTTGGQVLKNLLEILLFLGVGAIFGFGGYGLIRGGREASRKRAEFEEGNVTVEGRVVRRIEQKVKSSNPYVEDKRRRYVLVKFSTDSGEFSLRAQVSKTVFDSVAAGQVIRVRYATSNPRIALLEGESRW